MPHLWSLEGYGLSLARHWQPHIPLELSGIVSLYLIVQQLRSHIVLTGEELYQMQDNISVGYLLKCPSKLYFQCGKFQDHLKFLGLIERFYF